MIMNQETYLFQMHLMKVADRAASVILGTLRKDRASGQGVRPYLAALREGTQYLQDSYMLLTDQELTLDQASRAFELAFEKILLTFGDIYDPICLTQSAPGMNIEDEIFGSGPFDLDPFDLDDDDDLNL